MSLHPFYRRRLASAFALRRVGTKGEAVGPTPKADGSGRRDASAPFEPVVLSESVELGEAWPMLIVCAAANVSDPGATPPGRAVASFTFSPTAIGGPLTGAAPTASYERLSAATAAATSRCRPQSRCPARRCRRRWASSPTAR